MANVFVMYGGTSADGRGPGYYVGKTENPKVAYSHFKEIDKNPFSCGKVIMFTDSFDIYMSSEERWTSFFNKEILNG